ncbi:MAG: HDIG domain-containing protein [Nitrospirae bacterium]|nr:HDIG domain-containing protein [Nitrospirota bacterium]
MQEAKVLIAAGCSPGVAAHCLAVSRTAVVLAEQMKRISVDRELVRLGGLFHDIGRSRSHDIHHAIVGVQIGREMDFPEPLLTIIERHIGAGITANEAERLGLPIKDYLPITPEEKIVSYADNLTKGADAMPFAVAVQRFRDILGPEHEGIELLYRQHEEIQEWMK